MKYMGAIMMDIFLAENEPVSNIYDSSFLRTLHCLCQQDYNMPFLSATEGLGILGSLTLTRNTVCLGNYKL